MIDDRKKFSFEEFKKIIEELKNQKIDYFVWGGFAFDAINRKITNHEDLDISFFKSDTNRILKLFKNWGYTTYQHGRKHDYRKDGYWIDILFLEDKGDYYEILGNISRDKISKKAFLNKNLIKINSFEFNIMPYEWFSLYKDKHYIPEKRKILNETIDKIIPLCKPLEILVQENVKKPQNMEEIEIK